jgi:hypothetical protein
MAGTVFLELSRAISKAQSLRLIGQFFSEKALADLATI